MPYEFGIESRNPRTSIMLISHLLLCGMIVQSMIVQKSPLLFTVTSDRAATASNIICGQGSPTFRIR